MSSPWDIKFNFLTLEVPQYFAVRLQQQKVAYGCRWWRANRTRCSRGPSRFCLAFLLTGVEESSEVRETIFCRYMDGEQKNGRVSDHNIWDTSPSHSSENYELTQQRTQCPSL